MALERLQRRPRGRVPQSDRRVVRYRRQQLAVRQEGHDVDKTSVALERLQRRHVAASHSLTVVSCDADASTLPSGEKATALT
jgi:hypothetical protein